MNVNDFIFFKGLTERFPRLSIPESLGSSVNNLRASLFSKRPTRLLAVEYDGFHLRAAIMITEGTGVAISHVAGSRLPDANSALEEALTQLRHASIDLPSHAILLAPGVIPALLELPVPPDKPRPALQMQELIKWELEPLVAEHTAVWPLEAILIGRGYLTYQQVQDLHSELEQQKRQKLSKVRFEDLALQRELITRNQVDECVLIQETLQSIDEDLICGWSPQTPTGDSESGPYPWLACAIGRTQRRQWIKLFQRHGLELDWIFPLIGCSSAALNGAATTSSNLVIDIRPGLLGYTRISKGSINAIHMYPTQGHPPSPTMLDHSITAGAETLWFCGYDPQLPLLSQTFSDTLDKPVHDIPSGLHGHSMDADILPANWSACIGAAHHALNLPSGVQTVAISARDPKPPFWQRQELWGIAAIGVAILVIVFLEISLMVRLHDAQETHEQVTSQLRTVESDVGKVETRIEEISKIEETLTQRGEDLQLLNDKQVFLQDTLPRRDRFVPALLDAITSSVSMEVLIDQITEHDASDIEVTGWALTEQTAQQFAQNLGLSLGPWERTVVDFKVWDNTGRLGIQGYAWSLQITPSSNVTDSDQENN